MYVNNIDSLRLLQSSYDFRKMRFIVSKLRFSLKIGQM